MSDVSEKTIEAARKNRDVTAALMSSGIPEKFEWKIQHALQTAGVNRNPEALLGKCQRNAVAVRDEFREADFEAIVVRGWANDGERGIVPRDMAEARAKDAVHWWVEVRIQDVWYTVDLASNLPNDRWGDLYFSPDRPPEYRPAEIEPDEMDAVREEYGLEPSSGLFDEPR